MGKKVSGPGRLGSAKAVKKSLKKGGQANIKTVPKEDSITVRLLDEPEDFHGYYEHFVDGKYQPCVTDECDGCDSDNPEEQRKNFRYLANGYVVDDQKVWAIKMPKSLVEILMKYYEKWGTLRDRDYELSRTGSGQNDTKYMATPEDKAPMKLSRFESKMHDLADVLASLIDDDDDDDEDEPPKKKSASGKSKPKKSRDENPWDDEDEDEKPRKKKTTKSSGKKSKPAVKRTVKRKK